MAYFGRADLLAYISDSQLNQFTDDTGDGSETIDNLSAVILIASNEADSYVASIYPTPFPAPYPQKIVTAAIIFACQALYARRLVPDEKNPFKIMGDTWRKLLMSIGAGEQPLDANFPREFAPVQYTATPNIINSNMF